MQDFEEMAKEAQAGYARSQESERQEREWFRYLAETVRTGREEQRSPEQIREALRERDIPEREIGRAERAADRIEEREARQRELDEATREAARDDLLYRLEQDRAGRDDLDFLFREAERLQYEDRVRSRLEAGRNSGLSDKELISVAAQAGISESRAQFLLDNTLYDDVDREYAKDQQNHEEDAFTR